MEGHNPFLDFRVFIENYISYPIGLIVFLLALRLFFRDFRRSYLLMARMSAGTGKENFSSIMWTLIGLRLRDLLHVLPFESRMLRRVRMRVEHEIFRPRPQMLWPLPEDDPDYDTEGLRPEEGAAGLRKTRARYKKQLADWQKAMRRIYGKGEQQLIRVDTPAAVNSRFPEIKRYFDVLKSLALDDEEENGDGRKFTCAMVIGSGFVTPLHLLTGLLIQFNEKWRTILKAFDHDANDRRGLRPGTEAGNLRQIQMFIYNCWLLWGPSIPLCTCHRWRARYITIQYGFGDENNSIEIVGERETVAASLAGLFAQMRAPGQTLTPMALPASVRGRLQLSGSLMETGTAASPLPLAARESWGGRQDERPVLFISQSDEGDAVKGDLTVKERSLGGIEPDSMPLRSKYYSAYLWVAFVLLRQHGQDWLPVSLEHGETEPWKDIVPFFEHGNLADAETCFFSKNQLVAKALNAIGGLVRSWPADEVRLRFAYACAIDDSGCGRPLAFPDWAGGDSIRALLVQAIADKAQGTTADSAVFARIAAEEIVKFDQYGAADGDHNYSACHLPGYIDRHYKTMDAGD